MDVDLTVRVPSVSYLFFFFLFHFFGCITLCSFLLLHFFFSILFFCFCFLVFSRSVVKDSFRTPDSVLCTPRNGKNQLFSRRAPGREQKTPPFLIMSIYFTTRSTQFELCTMVFPPPPSFPFFIFDPLRLSFFPSFLTPISTLLSFFVVRSLSQISHSQSMNYSFMHNFSDALVTN